MTEQKKEKKQSAIGQFFSWLGEILEDFFTALSSGSDCDDDDDFFD